MRIQGVKANNRKKTFEVRTERGQYSYPYAKLDNPPAVHDRVVEAYPDDEVGNEAFTYRLESGVEDTVHVDAILEYNQDPSILNEILIHQLTVEAVRALNESDLSKRELIRRLGTSASQLYRLLDPSNSDKSVGQMLALLKLLGRDVELVVRATKLKSPTTTRKIKRGKLVRRLLPTRRPPTHPGEILLKEFLEPLAITQSAFASRLGISFPRLRDVINAKRSVTPDTALRLAKVTGASADFWLGLQQDWDLWHALRSEAAKEIELLEPLRRVG